MYRTRPFHSSIGLPWEPKPRASSKGNEIGGACEKVHFHWVSFLALIPRVFSWCSELMNEQISKETLFVCWHRLGIWQLHSWYGPAALRVVSTEFLTDSLYRFLVIFCWIIDAIITEPTFSKKKWIAISTDWHESANFPSSFWVPKSCVLFWASAWCHAMISFRFSRFTEKSSNWISLTDSIYLSKN